MEGTRYDLCILGAGPAGYAAAMRAHDLGKHVLLIERDRVGGTGIHAGALSSKTMWHLSNDYAVACRADRGYRATGIDLSYPAVIEAVQTAVGERHATLMQQLEHLSTPSERGGQVDFVKGVASFISPNEVELIEKSGQRRHYAAEYFLVATGSSPRCPEGVEIDGERIFTSDQIESLSDFPESMVIVGAGVIGCEYAAMFANFGKTKINIIDRQPRILPFEDADVAEVVATNFEQMGVTIHRESKLESIRVVGERVEYVLTEPDGVQRRYEVERALISIGRVPNTSNIGLDRAGVAVDRGGGIIVEQTRSTTAPHIFAAGDVTTDVALANVAELEGRHAVEEMFGLNPAPIRHEALSAIMFLSPEVASVGLNELQAKAKGLHYCVGVVSNALINRNIAMRRTRGFIKLLASPEGKVLGLRVVGPEASSTIQGIAFLIDQGATLQDIDYCVHPHPAITEGVQECARLLLGRSLHKTEVFGPAMLRRCEG